MVCNTIFGCIVPPAWKKNLSSPRGAVSRRRFCGYTVSQILISLGSDADIITDYLYWETAVSRDYVPEFVSLLLTIFLGLAAFIWVLEVIEGRFGCKKCCGFQLKNSHILWFGVLLEDVPQIVLTVLIDYWYAPEFSIQGVINISTSVHDMLTKIRALLDGDVQEEEATGMLNTELVEKPISDRDPVMDARLGRSPQV